MSEICLLNSRYIDNIVDNFWILEDNFLLDLDEDIKSHIFMHRSFNAMNAKTQWKSLKQTFTSIIMICLRDGTG